MFSRVFKPTIYSLLILALFAIGLFYIFNGFLVLEMFDEGYGSEWGQTFLNNNVAAYDDPNTNEQFAVGFIEERINPTILFVYLILNANIFLWLLIGRFLKVDKPGVAKKYFIYWIILGLIGSISSGGICFYWLWIEEGKYYMQDTLPFPIFAGMSGISFLIYYIQSLLFTSRAMRVAVPFVSLVSRISFKRDNKDDDDKDKKDKK